MKRVYDLTLGLADGPLAPVEEAELARLLEDDPGARQGHVEILALEAALRASAVQGEGSSGESSLQAALATERSVTAIIDEVEARSLLHRRALRWVRRRPVPVALGVAACAAVAFLCWPEAGGERRTGLRAGDVLAGRVVAGRTPDSLRRAGGGARRSSSPLRLRLGAPGEVSPARFELAGGAALEVRSRHLDGALPAGGEPVTLDEGSVAIVREGEHAGDGELTLVTPHAQVTVSARSKLALVTVSAAQTRVDVHDGSAVIGRGGANIEVGARQGVVIAAGVAAPVHTLLAALFVSGSHFGRFPTDVLDGALVRRLQGAGFAVEVVDEAALAAPMIADKAVIVMSPSTSGVLGGRIRELGLDEAPVPIVCARPSIYGDLGLTAPGREAASFTGGATRVEILDPGHPLAAGLVGPQQVTRAPGTFGWGVPGAAARRIAVFPDRRKSERATIFAYERGAELAIPGAQSAGRRVGFFLHPDLGAYLTDAGWTLFDAAVKWAVTAPGTEK